MTNFVFVPPLAYSPPAISVILKIKKDRHTKEYQTCTPSVLEKMERNIIMVCSVSSAVNLFLWRVLWNCFSTTVREVVTCFTVAMGLTVLL